jgi:hypothetical protein
MAGAGYAQQVRGVLLCEVEPIRRAYCTMNCVLTCTCCCPSVHSTTIGQVPGVVRVPTRHTHTIWPLSFAFLGTSPCARLGPDL